MWPLKIAYAYRLAAPFFWHAYREFVITIFNKK